MVPSTAPAGFNYVGTNLLVYSTDPMLAGTVHNFEWKATVE